MNFHSFDPFVLFLDRARPRWSRPPSIFSHLKFDEKYSFVTLVRVNEISRLLARADDDVAFGVVVVVVAFIVRPNWLINRDGAAV